MYFPFLENLSPINILIPRHSCCFQKYKKQNKNPEHFSGLLVLNNKVRGNVLCPRNYADVKNINAVRAWV